jgi:hypothetical protein
MMILICKKYIQLKKKIKLKDRKMNIKKSQTKSQTKPKFTYEINCYGYALHRQLFEIPYKIAELRKYARKNGLTLEEYLDGSGYILHEGYGCFFDEDFELEICELYGDKNTKSRIIAEFKAKDFIGKFRGDTYYKSHTEDFIRVDSTHRKQEEWEKEYKTSWTELFSKNFYDSRIEEITKEELCKNTYKGITYAVYNRFERGCPISFKIETEHDLSKMSKQEIKNSIKLGCYTYSTGRWVSKYYGMDRDRVINTIKVFGVEHDSDSGSTRTNSGNFYIVKDMSYVRDHRRK